MENDKRKKIENTLDTPADFTSPEVLFEELSVIDGKSYYTGYTKEYVKVAKSSEENLENRIIKGVLTQMLNDEVYLMM